MNARERAVAQPPSRLQRGINRAFFVVCKLAAWAAGALVALIVLQILFRAAPALREQGLGFLTGTTWDPKHDTYGVLPAIWGTLYSSLLAITIGGVLGVAVAIFLSEGFFGMFAFTLLRKLGVQHRSWAIGIPDKADALLRNLVELLAAIPSVVYGLWGIYVVIPTIRPWCTWLHDKLGWTPLFDEPLQGPGMLPAVIVLSIMILPTVTALSRDALTSMPQRLRVAAVGIGATRWETILAVVVPHAKRGIFGAVLLAFGRALGETMALAMLVGNANEITVSLFSPANTLAALLANTFPEAGPSQVPVLMYAALVLLLITLLVNVFGALVLGRGEPVRGHS